MKKNPGVLFQVINTRGRHILSVSSLPSSPSALTFQGTHFTHVTTVVECNKKRRRFLNFFFTQQPVISGEHYPEFPKRGNRLFDMQFQVC